MKSYRKELWFEVPTRRAFLNITPDVEETVRESGVQEGLVLVNAMHITASVFINDDEPGLHHDFEVFLERLASHEPTSQYHHNRTGVKWSWRSPTDSSISDPGNRSSMGSSTAAAASGCSSRSSANSQSSERARF